MAITAAITLFVIPAVALAEVGAKSYGQDLVDRTMAAHPDLIGLDVHAIPPEKSESQIIASSNPSRMGDKTDPDDLEVMKTGTPRVEINRRGDQNVEVALQLHDVTGRPVGSIELTFPYKAGSDEDALIQQGQKIEDELRRRIAGEERQGPAELVAPAQLDPLIPIDTYAQFLVDDTLAMHPGVAIIALHIKAPSGSDYPLLASNIGRIGKPSDASDRGVIETGKPVLAVSRDGDRLEAKLPLQDVTGDVVGAVAIVFPFGGRLETVTHRQEAFQHSLLRQAESIRDILRRRIASASNLYEPYPYEPGAPTRFPRGSLADLVVEKTLGKHPEALILILHAQTPNNGGYPIVASNIGRVGKKADPDDLRVIETGKARVAVIDPLVEVEVPLHDASGKPIGAMGVVYRYAKRDGESVFLWRADTLEREVRRMIPSAARLVEPVRPPQSEYDVPELGNVQELPMTKAVVSGKALEEGAQEGYSEAIKGVAGVAPANSKGSPNDSIYIRGIKLNLFSNYRLNGGLSTAGVITTPTEDKERIETLKGANALMFGVASPAGIINLVTKRAGNVDVTSVSLAGNSFGQAGGSIDIGRRYGAEREFGIRINGSAVYLQNGVRNMYGDGEFAGVGLDYKASDRLTLQGDFEYYRKHVPEQAGISLLLADRPGDRNGVVPITPVPDPRNLLSGRWAIYTPDTKNAQARADYLLTDDLKLVSEIGGSWASRSRYSVRIGSYDLVTGEGGVVSTNSVSQRYQNLFGRVELLGHASTGFLQHQATLGVSVADRQAATPSQNNADPQTQNIYNPVELPPPVFTKPPTSLQLQTSTDLGLYFYDIVSIGRPLKLLAGLRATIDREVYVKRSTKSVYTPAFGALFDVVPSLTLFASYMQGLEVGATAPVNANNKYEILAPAVSTQYEVGIRDSHIKGISASVSYFDITRANAVTNSTTNFFEAAGDIHYWGVEGTVSVELLRRLTLDGAMQWLRSVQNNPADPNIDGLTPENTPRALGNVRLSYRLPWIPGLTLGAGLSGITKRYVNPQDQGVIPGYIIYNASIGYTTRALSRRMLFQLYADNLTNVRYWNSVQTGTYGTGMDRSFRLTTKIDL
jgi:iron complex outermembrane receptor protein